jgi:FtsP/CotA-like multicopper oxidase with cupredoxin domain
MDEERQNGFAVLSVAIACVALIAGMIGVGFGMRAIDESESVSAGGPAGGQAVTVSLSEFAIEPSAISVEAGGRLTVTNDGAAEHNLSVVDTDLATPMIAPGSSTELDISTLEPGEYEVLCQVAGHESAGMTGTLTVGGNDSLAAADHAGMDHSAMGFEEMDARMRERTVAFPAETEGTGAQDLAPTVDADGTKVFDLTVSNVKWEVEPGKVVDAMAYNGTVPGPTIRTDVGDKVRIVVHNELDESTAVHFHGLLVPNSQDGVPDITQPPIEPGQTFTYEFTTNEPAVGMYHSHHNAAHQVPDGLAGAFLVGHMPVPAGGPAVTQEIPMMLNDAGAIGFSLNGKSFPATAPIVAAQGERIVLHYLNEGLSAHPMHLHGMPQLVVAKDGWPLPQPYLADTINVAPGERYTVVVDATIPGTWAWHCHILTHAESDDGMFGMVTALVVE